MTTAVATNGQQQQKPPTQAAKPTSRLGAVKKGRIATPIRLLAYGVEGVGKSTLAAHAPDPIWIDAEDGSARLDVARYQFRDEPGGHVPRSLEEFNSALADLGTNDHPFKTLVVDTVDRLESLIWRFMIERDKNKFKEPVENIEDYGYGKGYNVAVDEWRGLCGRFDRLRARGMNIILLGHATVRTFKNPTGEDFDRYGLRINEKAAGFLREWSDITGFCCFDDDGKKLKGEKRARGVSTGRRLIKVERTAVFDAKTRYSLPAEMELDPANPWAPFAKAVEDAAGMSADALRGAIGAELTRIGDAELNIKVAAAVTKAGDTTDALHRFLQELRKREPAGATSEG